MKTQMITYFLSLLLVPVTFGLTETRNGTLTDFRLPRVSGRIVKLYSGTRPEPIFCPDEGFQPDLTDCAVFYRCMRDANGKFTVFRFQCGPGTVYDPETEVCNHPHSTKRSECGGRVARTTERGFENEIDEVQPELPSPLTTKNPVYNERTTKGVNTFSTAYPWATQTKLHVSQKASTISNQPSFMTSATKKRSTQSKTTTSIPRQKNSQNGVACTSDGFMGDSENCRKFYRCVGNQRGGFIKYEFSCSESTIWDEDAQSCNHPWAVQRRRCGRGNSHENSVSTNQPIASNEKNPSSTSQQQIQINYGSKVTQTQTQISDGAVVQNQTQINYGDRLTKKEDSNAKQNQTQISNGSAVSQSQTQVNYGDRGMQTQLQIDHSMQSSQAQSQEYESTDKIITTSQHNELEQSYNSQSNSEEPNHNESNKCDQSGFMGDQNDCKKFYRCVNNGRGGYMKYEFSCGDGTVWDSKIEACNHAWAVNECGGKAPVETSTPGSTTTTSTSSTQNYYTSAGTTTTEDTEDVDNGYVSQNKPQKPTSTTTTTNQPEPIITEASNSDETTCTSSGFIGDENDCKKFYRCVDNGKGSYTKYDFKCGEGTVWDQNIEACNHVWAVKKCGGSSAAVNNTVNTTTTSTTAAITTVTLTETTTQTFAQNVDYETGYGQQQSENPLVITTTAKQPQNTELGGNNQCNSSGFMGDKNDCKKFYRCVDNGNGSYTRYEFSCGEGTVWDPEIQACNHAWAVKMCGGVETEEFNKETTSRPNQTVSDEEVNNGYTMENENETENPIQSTSSGTSIATAAASQERSECQTSGFMGDADDCKKFYRCVDDGKGGFDKFEFSCSEGTLWDQSIESCNHARDVECSGKGNYSTQTDNETTKRPQSSAISENEDNGPVYNQTSSESSVEPSSTNKPSSDKQCSQEGFIGDDDNCKKFYRCVDNGNDGYIKYEFSCGEGTVWDQDILSCNFASPNKSCGASVNEATSKEPDRENDDMITESALSTSMSSTEGSDAIVSSQKPQESSGTCDSDGFYGDPNDCKKFYRCVDNSKGGYTKYDFSCGDGTVWDQEIQACNHASQNENCTKNTVSSTPISETQPENNEIINTSTISTTTEEKQPSPITETSSCSPSGQCTSEGFYANPNNCKKFYRCVNDGKGGYTKYDFSCGEGTLWVQDIQACDHDDGTSNCSQQCGSISSTPQAIKEQESTTITPEYPSATTSAQYQKPNKEDDEYPSETSSQNSVPEGESKGECSSEGFHANKKDCKRFYRCVDNDHGGYTKYDFVCGEGTAWDSDIQSCNHISEVKSCKNSYQEDSQTKPVMQDEETSHTTENVSTIKTSTSEPATESSKPGNKDTCEHEGYFGNTEDCKKFYRCVDNGNNGLTKYDFTCGDGTIWDQDITACNHPRDVTNPSCQQSDSNASSSSDPTMTSSSSGTGSPSSSESPSSAAESSSQSSNCSQENTSKKPANKNVTCDKAGYYGDANDCKKFYRCVDWDGDGKRFSVYHFECGEGTIWDPSLDTCNHEDSVYPARDCSGAQSQNENVNQESTTTESTTIQEETTTQQSTTTEQTTTQDSTTKEQTTAQQTTTEETATQQTTSSEQTTAQQTTTNEQTTSQQPTTQPTTTGGQNTSEQTTKQTTTSEQTTAEQTTSEQTTTKATTTNDQTTAHQTTTQQSTSSEQTTTQQTTSEQTTTQQTTTIELTTSEQTTTQQTSTSDDTIQQTTTTEQSTTTTETDDQQITTDQSTNNKETTTQESSTDELTTENETTEESTTEQSFTTESEQESTTENEQSTTEGSTSSKEDCPETEDDQNLYVCPTSFRRHPKYCNMFYQCIEDEDNHEVKIATFNCPNNTIYDENKTQCVEEEKADKKCDGEIAKRRRVKRLDSTYKEPIVVNKERLKCPTVGHFPFEKEDCSSAFLKCERAKSGKVRGYVYQCPEGYVYWSVSRRCELKSYLRDCKHSHNNWSGRWEIPIERKNVSPH